MRYMNYFQLRLMTHLLPSFILMSTGFSIQVLKLDMRRRFLDAMVMGPIILPDQSPHQALAAHCHPKKQLRYILITVLPVMPVPILPRANPNTHLKQKNQIPMDSCW